MRCGFLGKGFLIEYTFLPYLVEDVLFLPKFASFCLFYLTFDLILFSGCWENREKYFLFSINWFTWFLQYRYTHFLVSKLNCNNHIEMWWHRNDNLFYSIAFLLDIWKSYCSATFFNFSYSWHLIMLTEKACSRYFW